MAKTILIADDSSVFRTLEAAFLTQRGYQVLHASDGAEALRIAMAGGIDLLLLDIQMPVMDGVSVLSALRSQPATQQLPVIVITTIGREKDRDIMLRGGASDFLSKPIDGRELIVKVQKLLEP